MKFEVGDKVKVSYRTGTWLIWANGMDKWLGKTLTIKMKAPLTEGYFVEENSYIWCDEMLEPAEEGPEMEEPYHLVFCKHIKSGKAFLFALDPVRNLHDGDKVLVDTCKGESQAVVVGDSFCVGSHALKSIAAAMGATLPLRKVIGKYVVEEKQVIQKVEMLERF